MSSPSDPGRAADLRAWSQAAFASWRDGCATLPPAPLSDRDLRRLGLAPLIYRALDAAADPRAERFRADHRHAATANLIRLSHAATVRDRLEARGIPVVLLKGGAFVVRYAAATPGIRPMSDLDWLVPANRFDDAAALLAREGFVRADARPWRAAPAVMATTFTKHDDLAMTIDIDLHRDVAQWPYHRGLAAQVLRGHEQVDGWRIPARPDAFAVAAVHRARHAFVWSCLDLVEVRLLLDDMDDAAWAACVAQLTAVNAVGAAYATLRQALRVLGDTSPVDEARLGSLAALLSRRRRTVLERLAQDDGPFLPPLAQERPLTRTFVVQPAVTGSWSQSLLAAATHFPGRVAEEWRDARGSRRARLGRIWHHVIGGARHAEAPEARPPRSMQS